MTRWRVTAFRPRRHPINGVEFRGKYVSPEQVEFTLLDNGSLGGLYLFLPGMHADDTDYKVIGYLLLTKHSANTTLKLDSAL